MSKVKDKKKRNSFIKSFDWSRLKFDPIRLAGRTYYLRLMIATLIIDILVILNLVNNINKIAYTIFNIILLVIFIIFSIRVHVIYLLNRYYIAKNNEYKQRITEAPRCQCSSGPPGSGKSSNEAWKVVELAKYQWKKLQEEYFFYMHQDRSKLPRDKQEDYDEIVFAYNFEIHSKNKIHCLWSNIPIKDANNPKLVSHKLKKAHLLQKLRVPYRSVLFDDEIGSVFPAIKGQTTSDMKKVSMFGRWIRQFTESFWVFTEQEFTKTFIDLRRVTGSNRYFKGQTWELKPKFLIWLYNLIFNFVTYPLRMSQYYKPDSKYYDDYIKKAKRRSKLFSGFLRRFKRYIQSIGWRHYIYVELGNTEVDIKSQDFDKKGDGKARHIYLPSCLNCRYDDRAFRNAYDAIDFDLLESDFASDKLTKEDIKELFENTIQPEINQEDENHLNS